MASSLSEQEGKDGNKLQPTLDIIQKRFSCGIDELTVWRNCLLYRYSAIVNSDVSFQFTDYDHNELAFIPSPYILSVPPPPNLAKTVFRIGFHSTKSVTLTLYFSLHSGGTLLCQGIDCPEWDKSECEILNQVVSIFVRDKDSENLFNSLLKTPLTFISAFSGTICLKPPSFDMTQMTFLSVSSSKDLSPPSQSQLLLEPNADGLAQDGVILFPPTPLVAPDSHNKEQNPKEQKKTTPVGKRTRQQCRRSLYRLSQVRSASNPLPELKRKVAQLEQTVDSLSSVQSTSESDVTSLIEDLKIATKNELRINICDKFNTICSKIDDLNSLINKLETSNRQLVKENHSIKTQLGTLQSEMKKVQSVQKESVTTSTQTVSVNETSNQRHLNVSTQTAAVSCIQTTNSTSPVNDVQLNTVTEAHSLTTTYTRDNSQVMSQSTDINFPVSDIQNNSSGSPPLPSNNDDCMYSVPTSNSFSVLSDTDNNPVTDLKSQSPKKVFMEDVQAHKSNPISKSTPMYTLGRMSIPDRATVLLVGDSTIRYINPKRLAPRHEQPFKICVPGMSVEDLHTWLLSLPIAPNLKYVIFHVGINSCPPGPVSPKTWSDLIILSYKVFPRANITFSSILPARGKHSFNNSIFPSNRNLKTACNQHKVTFIDNFSTFAADTDLYSNIIHPNARGTAKLAQNFKTLWQYSPHAESLPLDHFPSTNQMGFARNMQQREASAYSHPKPPAFIRSNPRGVQSHQGHTYQLQPEYCPSFTSTEHYPPLVSRSDLKEGVPILPPSTNHVHSYPARTPLNVNATFNEHNANTARDKRHIISPRQELAEMNYFHAPGQFHPHAEQLLRMASHLLSKQNSILPH